jgi:hypothetical protein
VLLISEKLFQPESQGLRLTSLVENAWAQLGFEAFHEQPSIECPLPRKKLHIRSLTRAVS